MLGKMTESEYQVGDLSSLLGFNSTDSTSDLFKRTAPSAFTQKLASRASLGSNKLAKKTTKNNNKTKKTRKLSSDAEASTAIESGGTRLDLESTHNDERSGNDSRVELSDVKDDGETQAASLKGEEEAGKKPTKELASSQLESKNARKKRKRRENALMEEREAEAFDGDDPGKKKKRKKEENSDEEEEAEENMAKKKKFVRDPADDDRTIFVGNIPKTTRKSHLIKLFSPCGKILKARIRGAVSNDPKQSKKVAAITNNIHHKLDSLFAYVVFENVEAVSRAVEKFNGAEFQDRHLRVDLCKQGVSGTCNDKLSVFVGNLPYDVSEESLRKLFHDSCGDVTRVRCVRDPATRMGKGFGYVEFRSLGAVKDAVTKSEQLTLDGRQLRIKKAALYGKNNAGGRNKFAGDPAGKRKKKGGNSGGAPFNKKKSGKGPKKFGGGGKKNLVKL